MRGRAKELPSMEDILRFARVGPIGEEVPVVEYDGKTYDLRPLTADIDGRFLADQARQILPALSAGRLAPFVVEAGARWGAPIARPSAIYCIGMNYAAHAAESGSAPPEHLVVFMKAPSSLAGPYDDVTIPRGSTKTDWEVELGVVIGARAHELDSGAGARAAIAGYTVVNDLSERDWQITRSGGQWSKGKSAPGFCPAGPWLVTPDEVDADDLRLRSWVNGSQRQDSRTNDLIFSIEEVLIELSSVLVLEPGDLILTGTPAGVAFSGRFPYLAHGDVVELEIELVGRQRQEFVGYSEASSHTKE